MSANWKGMERKSGSDGMGGNAEVYDAEMLGLLRGLEIAIVFQQPMPEQNRMQGRIVLLADNTPSVAAIISETPGSSQRHHRSVEAATHFLDKNREANIEVAWGPGHMGITGNGRVDEIAKEATKLEPASKTTTLANLFRQIWDSMKLEWVNEWASKPMTGLHHSRSHTTIRNRITCIPHAQSTRTRSGHTSTYWAWILWGILPNTIYKNPPPAYATKNPRHASTWYSNAKHMMNTGQ